MVNSKAACALVLTLACSMASAGNANGAQLRLIGAEDDEVARCIRESGHEGDFVEVRYVDETPMPALSNEDEQRGYLVFRRHWMDLVFPNSVPKREEITDTLRVFAARTEYEPVTFCVRALEELRELEVKAFALVSKAGGVLQAPEVRIVRCSPRMSPANSDFTRGPLYPGGPIGVMAMPTYLEEARAVDVAAGTTVQYWLTVHVDKDAHAGVYEGDILIGREGGAAHAIRLSVEVLPITLVEPTVTLGFWDFQAEPYGGEIGTVTEVYETMRRYGMNAVFTKAGLWERDPEGGTPYDFSRHLEVGQKGGVKIRWEGTPLAERLETAKRAGLKQVCYHPRFGFRGGFVGKVVSRQVDRKTLEQQTLQELERVLGRYAGSAHYELIKKEISNVSQRYFPVFSKAYGTLYVRILREILEEGRRREWPEILVCPGDERFSHQRKKHQRGDIGTALPLAERELELMKRAGATTIMNQLSPFMLQRKWAWFGDYAREAARFVDIGMPVLRPSYTKIPGTLDEVIRQVVDGLAEWDVTMYTYNVTIFGMPDLEATRFNSGYLFKTLCRGVKGEYDYIFFHPQGDAYNPLDGYDYMWFFPASEEDGRLGGPALWLEAKREGVDDLSYLQTLESLVKRSEARTGSADVLEAVQAAQEARRRIVGSFDFSRLMDADRLGGCLSRWDSTVALPGTAPTIMGTARLPNGWDLETYDRNRREIAEAIMRLQKALDGEE